MQQRRIFRQTAKACARELLEQRDTLLRARRAVPEPAQGINFERLPEARRDSSHAVCRASFMHGAKGLTCSSLRA